ncbi:MAG: DUF6114 domain-containing protein [Candidatus Bathyarchaeia archaeon]
MSDLMASFIYTILERFNPPRIGMVRSMGEKPTAAFVLSLVAGILILLSGIFSAIVAIIGGAIVGMVPGFGWLGGLIMIMGILGFIFGIIVIIGAVMINSGERERVKTGSIIVLIFSILSLLVSGGGFFIGFILGLVGSILGLTWKPPEKPQQPQQPQPT